MYDDILPFEPAAAIRREWAEGRAELRFAGKGGVTRLDHLYQHAPLRVLFPAPRGADPVTASLVTVSGGLVGGDRIAIEVVAEERAEAFVHAQAAEKVYRSAGDDVDVRVSLSAEAGSWLEYLPQETILFDGSRLVRRTRVDVVPGARLLAGEIGVFGRGASGETWRDGLYHECWEVHRAGELIWKDVLHLDETSVEALSGAFGFDGATATATAVYAGDDPAISLATARNLLAGGGETVISAATLVDDLLVVRWLAREPRALRDDFGKFWAGFRSGIAGLPGALPRLWHV